MFDHWQNVHTSRSEKSTSSRRISLEVTEFFFGKHKCKTAAYSSEETPTSRSFCFCHSVKFNSAQTKCDSSTRTWTDVSWVLTSSACECRWRSLACCSCRSPWSWSAATASGSLCSWGGRRSGPSCPFWSLQQKAFFLSKITKASDICWKRNVCPRIVSRRVFDWTGVQFDVTRTKVCLSGKFFPWKSRRSNSFHFVILCLAQSKFYEGSQRVQVHLGDCTGADADECLSSSRFMKSPSFLPAENQVCGRKGRTVEWATTANTDGL